MTKFAAFKIITQRPDKKLTPGNAKCPFCNSKKYSILSTRSTLMGFNNHIWYERNCNDCYKTYTVEEKSGNTWITDENSNVLKGIPSCFEHYIYDCKCGGKVESYHTDLDEKEIQYLSTTFGEGIYKKNYKSFYKCHSCKKVIETETDYYQP